MSRVIVNIQELSVKQLKQLLPELIRNSFREKHLLKKAVCAALLAKNKVKELDCIVEVENSGPQITIDDTEYAKADDGFKRMYALLFPRNAGIAKSPSGGNSSDMQQRATAGAQANRLFNMMAHMNAAGANPLAMMQSHGAAANPFAMISSFQNQARQIGGVLVPGGYSHEGMMAAARNAHAVARRTAAVAAGVQDGLGLSAGGLTEDNAREFVASAVDTVRTGRETVRNVRQAVGAGKQRVDEARDSCHRCLGTPAGRVGAVAGGAAITTIVTGAVWGFLKFALQSLDPLGVLVVGGVSAAVSYVAVDKVRDYLAPVDNVEDTGNNNSDSDASTTPGGPS